MAKHTNWKLLTPIFKHPKTTHPLFTRYVACLVNATPDDLERCKDLLTSFIREAPLEDRQRLLAAGLVLVDLALQGWALRVTLVGVEVAQSEGSTDAMLEKERIRKQELLKRDEQLRLDSVRNFIRSVERRRLFKGMPVSIFSLMRDGAALSTSLRSLRDLTREEALSQLARLVSPYLQFISEGERCTHTNLPLQEIWRYFRHTWSNQYTSAPGRGMLFLVRDGAAPYHPVIGIGALASPIIQLKQRDAWIGWQPCDVLKHLQEAPSDELARWVQNLVDRALKELYVEDLLADDVLPLCALQEPSDSIISRLLAEKERQRELHQRFVNMKELKGGRERWVQKARTHLFRSKRAGALAALLPVRQMLRVHFGETPTARGLAALVRNTAALPALLKLFKRAKAERVGISMADISVCGAVPPYNALLGGKLVSMLAVSPEVSEAYRKRYQGAESEIASSMAGRSIIRPAHLVFLGTTSLYGAGSSQYSRLRLPCELLGGRQGESLSYLKLGKSEAFGTSHYSSGTVEALATLTKQSNGGHRVNNIFGEGVSPKLRKVRDGLEELGLPSDLLLSHGRQRLIYGISLVRNLRGYLLGIEEQPSYLLPLEESQETTQKITAWWRQRWLLPRCASDQVLSDVARHATTLPVRHGARVVLPAVTHKQQELIE